MTARRACFRDLAAWPSSPCAFARSGMAPRSSVPQRHRARTCMRGNGWRVCRRPSRAPSSPPSSRRRKSSRGSRCAPAERQAPLGMQHERSRMLGRARSEGRPCPRRQRVPRTHFVVSVPPPSVAKLVVMVHTRAGGREPQRHGAHGALPQRRANHPAAPRHRQVRAGTSSMQHAAQRVRNMTLTCQCCCCGAQPPASHPGTRAARLGVCGRAAQDSAQPPRDRVPGE